MIVAFQLECTFAVRTNIYSLLGGYCSYLLRVAAPLPICTLVGKAVLYVTSVQSVHTAQITSPDLTDVWLSVIRMGKAGCMYI